MITENTSPSPNLPDSVPGGKGKFVTNPGHFDKSNQLMTGAIFGTILVLVWTAFSQYQSYQDRGTNRDRQLDITKLTEKIRFMDEVMDMSALMLANTGDSKWYNSYAAFAPRLDAALQEVVLLTQGSTGMAGARQTYDANSNMMAIERASLELSRLGRREEAAELLRSGPYQKQQAIYDAGMAEVENYLNALIQESVGESRRHDIRTGLNTLGAAVLLLLGWFLAIRTVRRWEGALLEANKQLSRQAKELRESNSLLDRAVEARTSELETSRQNAMRLLDKAVTSEAQTAAYNTQLQIEIKERELAEYEARQALATLDATEDGAFIFDAETLLHSYVNKGAMLQLGYSREELLRMKSIDFKPEYDEALYRQMLANTTRGGSRAHRFTTLHKHRDGHVFPVEVSLQSITDQGAGHRFIAIARDISDRQESERIALRSQRLESLGTLAGGVAHDLNNALAPIMMGMGILQTSYPEESEVLEAMQNSAQRGADMVRQLLRFAKGTDGARVSVQISYLIKEIKEMIDVSFPKNIEFEVHREENLPMVLGDATQLHQVLLNLCVNARDAMPDGGMLRLDVSSVELSESDLRSFPDAVPGPFVALRVSDTGPGIPSEFIERIFEPFFTSKAIDKGTGLGLSTVIGIVKGHGGSVEVVSELGKGATFTVYLPAKKAECEHSADASTGVKFRGNGEIILLADDEALVREVGCAVLQQLNFHVLTAVNGADALLQVMENKTRLSAILTDLHMPQMGGLALVRELRRLVPDMPIIVASGRMEDEEAEELVALGVHNLLPKPFTEDQLLQALQDVLPTSS